MDVIYLILLGSGLGVIWLGLKTKMDVIYLILLGSGLGVIWLGLKTKDEIYRLGAVIGGAIFLVWGFALTPSSLQFLFEAIALIAVFPVCMRCLKE